MNAPDQIPPPPRPVSASWIFICSTLETDLGGISRSVPRLALAVARAGVPVRFLGVRAERMTFDPTALTDWEAVALVDNPHAVGEVLREWTASGSVQLLYHAGIWAGINHTVARLGHARGIPVVVSPRSMLDPWALAHRRWKKRLAWWLYARRDVHHAAAVHATADLEARHVRTAGYRGPVVVAPNGVDLPPAGAVIPPDPKPPGRFRLLFLSRLHVKKGLPDLLNGFGQLNLPDWELVIAGNDDGGHEAACRRLARTLPNADRVRFVGPVEDAAKWPLYASADLFVLPSYSENFGIVVAEALGMGIPVITTTAAPWGELVTRRCGWSIPTGCAALRAALAAATGLPPAERAEMGNRGAAWIRQSFAWDPIGLQFRKQIESLPSIFSPR